MVLDQLILQQFKRQTALVVRPRILSLLQDLFRKPSRGFGQERDSINLHLRKHHSLLPQILFQQVRTLYYTFCTVFVFLFAIVNFHTPYKWMNVPNDSHLHDFTLLKVQESLVEPGPEPAGEKSTDQGAEPSGEKQETEKEKPVESKELSPSSESKKHKPDSSADKHRARLSSDADTSRTKSPTRVLFLSFLLFAFLNCPSGELGSAKRKAFIEGRCFPCKGQKKILWQTSYKGGILHYFI